MKRHSSIFRTTILAITASLCFTQATLKADGLASEILDWVKIHVNAAWNVDDLDSRAGLRNTALTGIALFSIYKLADTYEHDTQFPRAQKWCGYAKTGVKVGSLALLGLGFYNMANNLGWGPGETLFSVLTLLGYFPGLLSMIFSHQPQAQDPATNTFPEFDRLRTACPTLVAQVKADKVALGYIQDERVQTLSHTLLHGSDDALGSTLLVSLYESRKKTSEITGDTVKQTIQFIDLAKYATDEERAEQLNASFATFSNIVRHHILFIDSIDLLNGKTPQALAALEQLLKDNTSVRLIAHTTKLGALNPAILTHFNAAHQIELRESISGIPEEEMRALIQLIRPSAPEAEVAELIRNNRDTTLKNFVLAVNKSRKISKVLGHERVTHIGFEKDTKALEARVAEGITDGSFVRHRINGQNVVVTRRNEKGEAVETKRVAKPVTPEAREKRLQDIAQEEKALNEKLSLNQPDSIFDTRTQEQCVEDWKRELARLQQEETKLKAEPGQLEAFASQNRQTRPDQNILELLKEKTNLHKEFEVELAQACKLRSPDEVKSAQDAVHQKFEPKFKRLGESIEAVEASLPESATNSSVNASFSREERVLAATRKLILETNRAIVQAKSTRDTYDFVKESRYKQIQEQNTDGFNILERGIQRFRQQKNELEHQLQVNLQAAGTNQAEAKRLKAETQRRIGLLPRPQLVLNRARNGGPSSSNVSSSSSTSSAISTSAGEEIGEFSHFATTQPVQQASFTPFLYAQNPPTTNQPVAAHS